MKSKIPIKGVPTMRGSRYAGKSKMNFISLVTHGLSAVSVFIEEALIRILLVSLIVSTFSIIGIFIVILIRFFTDLAIPGWATYAVGIFTVVFLQTIMLLVFAVFNILNNRSNLLVVPVLQTKHFILGRITLYKK